MQSLSRRLTFLCMALVVIGVCIRFLNLEAPVYWHDEVYTSLHVNGYARYESSKKFFRGEVISPHEVLQHVTSVSGRGMGKTLKVLATSDPHHSPLAYLLAQQWTQFFGASIHSMRVLTVLISALFLPCLWWLCRELFASALVDLLTLLLVSISPIFVLYARESREYSLWLVTVTVLAAFFLRALRIDRAETSDGRARALAWASYAIALTICLYTSILGVFVAAAQFVYLVVSGRGRVTRPLASFFAAGVFAAVLFSPWIWVIINGLEVARSANKWMTDVRLPAHTLFANWALHLSRAYIDFDWSLQNSLSYPFIVISCFFTVMVLSQLIIRAERRVWLFLLTWIFTLPAILGFYDLVFGGILSLSGRYLLASYIPLLLAVAYFFGWHMTSPVRLRRGIACVGLAILLLAGGLSSYCIANSRSWWTKVISKDLPLVADIVKDGNNVLVVSDDHGYNTGNALSLALLLPAHVKLQLFRRADALTNRIPMNRFDRIFILNPSRSFRASFHKAYDARLSLIFEEDYITLWEVRRLGT